MKIKKDYKIYRNLRTPIQVFSLDLNLASFFLAALLLVFLSFIFGFKNSLSFTIIKIGGLFILYLFLALLSANKKRLLLFQAQKFPNQITFHPKNPLYKL
jgi:hypothetical protein